MDRQNAKRLYKKYIGKFLLPDVALSYSQFGEDRIIDHFFAQLNIKKPSYLDIGANEPKYISNTYFFYEKGSKGVLVEPNPSLAKKLSKYRSKDIVINSGIGIKNQSEADFYLFSGNASGLSTFSKEEAEHWGKVGMKGTGLIHYEKIIKMPLVPVNEILEKHFKEKAPDILSLDVEGLDLQILKSLDFNKWQPFIICVETLLYDKDQKGYKNNAIINFMLQKEYVIYADTRVNTIFCKKEFINK